MSLKGEGIRNSSFRRYSLAIILGTSVSWASAGALAQQAAPGATLLTAPIASSSLEGPISSSAPHLVIGMLEPGDAPSNSSLRTFQVEATSPSASAALSGVAGQAVSLNRNDKVASAPRLLSSLESQAAGIEGVTNFRLQSISGRRTVHRSYHAAAVRPYSLLNERPMAESFLYGSPASYLASQENIPDGQSFALNPDQGSLLQLKLDSWSLPVTLYSAPVAR